MLDLPKKHMKFLITGGSGFIGSKLCDSLLKDGHDLFILSRNFDATEKKFSHRATIITELSSFHDEVDVIINLSGENISCLWTQDNKHKIIASRVGVTKNLIEYIVRCKRKPSIMISGSAIGIYGSSPIECDENTKIEPGGFARDLCVNWERSALEAESYGVRTVLLRTSIVLGKEGGMLSKLLLPWKLCLGTKFGSGKHYMSWIHIEDVTGIIAHIIKNEDISGAINLSSPHPVTNHVFTQSLAKALNRIAFMSVPSVLLRLFGGKMAEELLLANQYVVPKKAVDTGYKFQWPKIEQALKDLVT